MGLERWFTPSKSDKGTATDSAVRQQVAVQQAAAIAAATMATPNTALSDAAQAADNRRRSILSSGGVTDQTKGAAILGQEQTASKTLLGS